MVTYLGSLVQSCGGNRGTLEANIPGVCEEHSQCLSHTGFAPAHSIYTSQALSCSARNCLRRALGCVHFPGLSCSGSGSRVLLGWVYILYPSQVLAAQVTGAWRVQSPPGGQCILLPPPSRSFGFLLGLQRARLLTCALPLLGS